MTIAEVIHTASVTLATSKVPKARSSGCPRITADEHQHGRDEERDLHRRSDRDARGEIHAILARHEHRRAVLRGVANDRNRIETDEDIREPERVHGGFGRADEQLGHPADGAGHEDEHDERALQRPRRRVVLGGRLVEGLLLERVERALVRAHRVEEDRARSR